MSGTLELIAELVERKDVMISDHGYDELAENDMFVGDVIVGIAEAVIIEDYPEYPKGPCVLVLQRDHQGNPIHVVWEFPKVHRHLLFWSRRIGQTQIDGQMIS